jgi:glutathione S-transferase
MAVVATSAENAGMEAVELFGLERSVYTRIARLALEEKGVAYTLLEVEIFGASGVPPEHRRRHPFGRIPVLRHGEFMLYETAAITRYVDEAFGGPPLQPATPALRAIATQITGLLDSYAYRPMVWGVFVERMRAPESGRVANEAKIAESLAAAATCLAALTKLASFEPFLLGPNITLADLHAFPMLRYLALAPEGRDTLANFPRLQQWMQLLRSRRTVQRTTGPYERSE